MVQLIHYDFRTLFRRDETPSEPTEEPRLILHASLGNMYWIIVFGAVNALVALPRGLYRIWQDWRALEGASRTPADGLIVFGIVAVVILVSVIAYCQRKARWLVATPSGLSVTERTTVRRFPWREVGPILDLGYLGGAPAAKRYHIEFADGTFFTFLGDPEAMARLEELRPRWRKENRE